MLCPSDGRRVDEDELVVRRDFVEGAAQAEVGVAGVLALAFCEDATGREHMDVLAPSRLDDRGPGRLGVGQGVGGAKGVVARVDPQRVGGRCLRVHIYDENVVSRGEGRRGEAEGDGGLAHPAFLVGDRDCLGHENRIAGLRRSVRLGS